MRVSFDQAFQSFQMVWQKEFGMTFYFFEMVRGEFPLKNYFYGRIVFQDGDFSEVENQVFHKFNDVVAVFVGFGEGFDGGLKIVF